MEAPYLKLLSNSFIISPAVKINTAYLIMECIRSMMNIVTIAIIPWQKRCIYVFFPRWEFRLIKLQRKVGVSEHYDAASRVLCRSV